MKSTVVRHLNDIVSLTVLALMAMALVAGEVEAGTYSLVEAEPDSMPGVALTRQAPLLSLEAAGQDAMISLQVVLEVRSQ
jgi:hypothetical protein